MTPQELKFNKKDTYTYDEVRQMLESAMMDRARYMGFFYKVMPRDLFDEYGKKALFAYGQFKAKNPFFDGKPTGDPKVMSDFLVSTNIFVRWYNNTPLFIGSIIGVVVLAVAIIAFLVFGKKKKKDKDKDE